MSEWKRGNVVIENGIESSRGFSDEKLGCDGDNSLKVKFVILIDGDLKSLPDVALDAIAEGLTLKARSAIRAVAIGKDGKPTEEWEGLKAQLVSQDGLRFDWRGLNAETLGKWKLPTWSFPATELGAVGADAVQYLSGNTLGGVPIAQTRAFYAALESCQTDDAARFEKFTKAIAKAKANSAQAF